ncbi:MAG TPA: DUF881 domain-containing protein [Micromonosporaceae bacterium]|nr:DUF881 domain-containing protein [Micromonosporaceae bacterium]
MTDLRRGDQSFGPNFLTDLFRDPLDPGYADAAASKRQNPPSGWRAATGRAAALVTLLLVGVLLAVAYLQTVADEPSRSKVRSDLVAKIKEREARTSQLQQRAEGLRDEVARQRAALTGGEASRLREQAAAAGLGRIQGDGVVVRISDAPDKPDAVGGRGEPNLGRVFDTDLQGVANALWSGGAEGIAINGQRLTATSTIRAAGGAILVDFQPVLGPYEVSAIGPDQLPDRFQDSDTARLLRRLADEHGMGFEMRRADHLVLPAASEPTLRYAKPVPTADTTSDVTPSTTPPSPVTGASPTASEGGR